jgi:endonuclease/exonuclease/phosphatase family metal-dependent hydrolase
MASGLRRFTVVSVATLGGVALVAAVALWLTTFHPDDVQEEAVVCSAEVPRVPAGATLRVMTWNVQYMAGKNHVFWYDLLDGSGPDERPAPEEIEATLASVARVIRDEDPDLLLLQEVDDGASRTDGMDQLQRLLAMVPGKYPCHASAFYWRAAFVPHPRIMGSVGMKLSVVSKYRIDTAIRHQLALIHADFVSQQLGLKRAVLQVQVAVEDGTSVAVMSTHLDAFAQGTDTMQRQVNQVAALLDALDREGIPWVIGGDFNLLPPGDAYSRLAAEERAYFEPDTELSTLTDRFQSVPALQDMQGPGAARWYTHFPNGGRATGPDRTIDYLFFSKGTEVGMRYVRASDTLAVSDHLPVVAEFTRSGPAKVTRSGPEQRPEAR